MIYFIRNLSVLPFIVHSIKHSKSIFKSFDYPSYLIVENSNWMTSFTSILPVLTSFHQYLTSIN